MTSLFLFLAKLTDLIGFAWKRKAAKNDLPETKNANRRAEVEKEILNDDEAAATKRINDDLFRLRNKRAEGDQR